MYKQVEQKKYLDYSDVLIKPQLSTFTSRSEAKIIRSFQLKHSRQIINSTPVIISNMDVVGTFNMHNAVDEYSISTCFHKFYTLDDYKKYYLYSDDSFNFVTIGMNKTDIKLLQNLYNHRLSNNEEFFNTNIGINIDVANGYMQSFIDFVSEVRTLFPSIPIMAGNICTPEIIPLYDKAGVDIVKVGIGAGGQCFTRTVAGIGVPQFTAVLDCAERAHNHGLMLCADGGIVDYADFSKALGAGADFVMAGSIFGGHTESGGDLITIDGKEYKEIYGMSSETAMKKYYKGDRKYRASEGRTSLIPFKGPVETTIQNIFGGIRSAMSYTGSKTLEEFAKNAQFIEVSNRINKKYEQFTVGN